MFTGIVEEVGEILAVDAAADVVRLTVRGPTVTSRVTTGADCEPVTPPAGPEAVRALAIRTGP